jgi:hypothetical protein
MFVHISMYQNTWLMHFLIMWYTQEFLLLYIFINSFVLGLLNDVLTADYMTWNTVKRWLLNNKFEKVWKEAIIAYSRKTTKKSDRVAGC